VDGKAGVAPLVLVRVVVLEVLLCGYTSDPVSASPGAARLEGRRFIGWQLYGFAAGASQERFAAGHV
jgi:hypothetical protein